MGGETGPPRGDLRGVLRDDLGEGNASHKLLRDNGESILAPRTLQCLVGPSRMGISP